MSQDSNTTKETASSSSRRVVGRPFKPGQSGNPKGRPEGSINKKQAVSALLRRSMKDFIEGGTLSESEVRQLQAKYPHLTNGKDMTKAIKEQVLKMMVDRQILKAIGENDTTAFGKVMDMLGKDIDLTSNGETIGAQTREEREAELLAEIMILNKSTTQSESSSD